MIDALWMSDAKLVITAILFPPNSWNFNKNWGPFASKANIGHQPELS